MPRYYVSFSNQDPRGFGIASLDVTTADPIATVDDLDPVYELIAQNGFRDNVKILAFSLYANSTSARSSNANPVTDRPSSGNPRRLPRPGRSS